MLKHPLIDREYIVDFCEIEYFGEAGKAMPQSEDLILNHGHRFQVIGSKDEGNEHKTLTSEQYEVIGWIERTDECPYDFILRIPEQERHYLAVLKGRSDAWPLFSVQEGKYTCARTRMGSEWNCRLCVKYFGTVCRGR